MTIAERVRTVVANEGMATRQNQFAMLAKCLMLSKGNIANANIIARDMRLGSDNPVESILREARSYTKSAASAMSLSGGALADYRLIAQGFVSSLINASAFDSMLSAMVPLPLATSTVGAVSVGSSAFVVGESSMKQVSKLTIVNQTVEPRKAHCLVVVTESLARSDISNALQLISRELRQSVSVATDTQFVSTLTSGLSVATSSGVTAEAVRADISNLLGRITTGSDSRLYILTTPFIVKMWSMLTDQKGVSAFPDLGPTSGSINGITVIPSDGVGQGLVVLVDASGCGAAQGEARLEEVSESVLQLDTAPDSPPTASTPFISLWQNNMVGVRVERYFAAAKLRSDCVAVASNSGSYQSGNSP
jgi:hypothetical protein